MRRCQRWNQLLKKKKRKSCSNADHDLVVVCKHWAHQGSGLGIQNITAIQIKTAHALMIEHSAHRASELYQSMLSVNTENCSRELSACLCSSNIVCFVLHLLIFDGTAILRENLCSLLQRRRYVVLKVKIGSLHLKWNKNLGIISLFTTKTYLWIKNEVQVWPQKHMSVSQIHRCP